MGMPGCGKSLCAKAIAREWSMQLLRLDTGSLFEKFVGETEKNLRKSLQVAEAVAPSVLWIDEIEKMFPRSSLNSEADGGPRAKTSKISTSSGVSRSSLRSIPSMDTCSQSPPRF